MTLPLAHGRQRFFQPSWSPCEEARVRRRRHFPPSTSTSFPSASPLASSSSWLAPMGHGRGAGSDNPASVRGKGRPSPPPTAQEKANAITAVGKRLGLSKDEIVGLRAAAAAVPLPKKTTRGAFKAQKNDAEMALLMLVDQALAAPDYATLGKGWFHPDNRLEYRRRTHDVFTCAASRARQQASSARLAKRLCAIAGKGQKGAVDLVALILSSFVEEIGAARDAKSAESLTLRWKPNLQAVRAALKAELLVPLRALTECDACTTVSGAPVPRDAVTAVIDDVAASVVSGRYSGGLGSWLYSNTGAEAQLAGLSSETRLDWMADESVRHGAHDGLVTVDESGLGVFWATKIGSPGHGFDYETQCLLPLVANARHKVILVKDPSTPKHATGCAHLRLIHFEDNVTPVLWLEAMNVDLKAIGVDDTEYLAVAISHAAAKAEKLGVALSMDTSTRRVATQVIEGREAFAGGRLEVRQERMTLRASVGVVEASDTLSHRHDWVQMADETTHEIRRLVYTPSSVPEKEEGYE